MAANPSGLDYFYRGELLWVYPGKVNPGSFDYWYGTEPVITVSNNTFGAQISRPSSDISTGQWTVSPLYQKIDETLADDTDYILSPSQPISGSGGTTEIQLSAIRTPVSRENHILKYRFQKTGVVTLDFAVQLYNGSTFIAQQYHSGISSGWTDGMLVLSSGQANSITDYSNLIVKLVAHKP